MRAINHALTGASVGIISGKPAVAIPLALVSHYICDIIPHYGAGTSEAEELNSTIFRKLLVIDVSLCATLVVVLVLFHPQFWFLAAICAFVATSPDLISINRYRFARRGKLSKPNRYVSFAKNIQLFEKPIGAVVEITWFAAMVIILLPFFHHR